MDFLKTITGKVIGGMVALAVIAGAITFWFMEPASRAALVNSTGKIILWIGVVLAWPWVSFALIGKVARMQSNTTGGMLVAAYTVVEVVLMAWLFSWHIAGAT